MQRIDAGSKRIATGRDLIRAKVTRITHRSYLIAPAGQLITSPRSLITSPGQLITSPS